MLPASRLDNPKLEVLFLQGCIASNGNIETYQHLTDEDFAVPVHGDIWKTLQSLRLKGRSAKEDTLRPFFESHPGLKYDFDEEKPFVTQAAMPDWARQLRDMRRWRELSYLLTGFTDKAEDATLSAAEAITELVAKLHDVQDADPLTSSVQSEVIDKLIAKGQEKGIYYSTGIPAWDRAMMGGLHPGTMIGVAARKKVGKTIMLGTLSTNLDRAGVKHAYIALEMSPMEIERRSVARELMLDPRTLRGQVDPAILGKLAQLKRVKSDHKVYVHKPGIRFAELRVIMGQLVRKGVKVFLIDYHQLIGGMQKGANEEQHLRDTAQWIADFARGTNTVAVVASQLNQNGNTRGGEGLRLACDAAYALYRETDGRGAGLRCIDARDWMPEDVGIFEEGAMGEWKLTKAGLIMEPQGPYFRDAEDLPDHKKFKELLKVDEDGVVLEEFKLDA